MRSCCGGCRGLGSALRLVRRPWGDAFSVYWAYGVLSVGLYARHSVDAGIECQWCVCCVRDWQLVVVPGGWRMEA